MKFSGAFYCLMLEFQAYFEVAHEVEEDRRDAKEAEVGMLNQAPNFDFADAAGQDQLRRVEDQRMSVARRHVDECRHFVVINFELVGQSLG